MTISNEKYYVNIYDGLFLRVYEDYPVSNSRLGLALLGTGRLLLLLSETCLQLSTHLGKEQTFLLCVHWVL